MSRNGDGDENEKSFGSCWLVLSIVGLIVYVFINLNAYFKETKQTNIDNTATVVMSNKKK